MGIDTKNKTLKRTVPGKNVFIKPNDSFRYYPSHIPILIRIFPRSPKLRGVCVLPIYIYTLTQCVRITIK